MRVESAAELRGLLEEDNVAPVHLAVADQGRGACERGDAAAHEIVFAHAFHARAAAAGDLYGRARSSHRACAEPASSALSPAERRIRQRPVSLIPALGSP